MGNRLAEQQKALNDNVRPSDEEGGGPALSSGLTFNLHSYLDLLSLFPRLLRPLHRSLFQHPIMASACCLSCGVHSWK